MSHTGYLVWLIAMALATIAILAVGTLAAADLLPLGKRRSKPEDTPHDSLRSEDSVARVVVAGHSAPD